MSASDREWLDKVYNAESNAELSEGYDEWAADYEDDVRGFGYLIPAVASGLFCRHVEPGGPVLDAGAGTGMMGEILHLLGYDDLTGIDLSQGMLERARRKSAYRSLRRMALGEPLDFPDGAFAAVISTGVFTAGHAPAHSLDELVRITGPGGHLVFSVKSDVYEESFREKQDALESGDRWRLVEATGEFRYVPLGEPESVGRVFVYRAL